MDSSIKVIAFYLPQFHPVPENDQWWEPGFTEWTNVTKAKPLYRGHYQPKLPADLGFYDLRVPETRMQQADMAKKYGISAFCYWHYWFGDGKRILERPFTEVLESGKPDFPFCLGWANTSWKGFDYGCDNERNLLIEQRYPSDEDFIAHFYLVLKAFNDPRYFRINGMPVFLLFQPEELPDQKHFLTLWNKLALENGLKGIFFIAQTDKTEMINIFYNNGFNAVNINRLFYAYDKGLNLLKRQFIRKFGMLKKIPYKKATSFFTGPEDLLEYCYPSVYPNWDHSARSGKKALILHDSKPKYFKEYFKKIISTIKNKKECNRVVFVKSWNEWAEGNYLEPDQKYGTEYLQAIKEVLEEI